MRVLIKTKLSPHKLKTPEGYLICQDAVLARTGPQEYMEKEVYPDSDSDNCIMVDRCPEDVFSPETLASFENKPLTCEHPAESVTPENFRELAVGWVRDIRRGTFEGQDVMLANVVVTDPDSISEIEQGIRDELSCGYDCDVTRGEHPKQTNIRGNHVALCERGRAGIAKIIDSQPVEYVVTSYYDDKLRGKEDELITNDFTKAKDFVWDKVKDGFPCKIYEKFSHREWLADPTEFSQFVKNIDQLLTEVDPKEIIVNDSAKSEYFEQLNTDLAPENISETATEITLQFPSKNLAERTVYRSKYKDVPYSVIEDESAYYIIFNVEDLNEFFYQSDKQAFKKQYDNVKYVIYAKDTDHNGRALYWFGNTPAKYCSEAEAPRFSKEYADKITAKTGGKYTWIAKAITATSAIDAAYKVLNKKYHSDIRPIVMDFLKTPDAIKLDENSDNFILDSEEDILFTDRITKICDSIENKFNLEECVTLIRGTIEELTNKGASISIDTNKRLLIDVWMGAETADDPLCKKVFKIVRLKLLQKYPDIEFIFDTSYDDDFGICDLYITIPEHALTNDSKYSHKFYEKAIQSLQKLSDELDEDQENADDAEDLMRLQNAKTKARNRINKQIALYSKKVSDE